MRTSELSVWDLIEDAKLQEVCDLADVEFQSSGDILPLRNKVFAFLQLRRFDEAARVSERIIKMTSGSTDTDFIFCAIANWLMQQRIAAVDLWTAGLKAKYSDAAGGVEVPGFDPAGKMAGFEAGFGADGRNGWFWLLSLTSQPAVSGHRFPIDAQFTSNPPLRPTGST